jgi:hypothetical protein
LVCSRPGSILKGVLALAILLSYILLEEEPLIRLIADVEFEIVLL